MGFRNYPQVKKLFELTVIELTRLLYMEMMKNMKKYKSQNRALLSFRLKFIQLIITQIVDKKECLSFVSFQS